MIRRRKSVLNSLSSASEIDFIAHFADEGLIDDHSDHEESSTVLIINGSINNFFHQFHYQIEYRVLVTVYLGVHCYHNGFLILSLGGAKDLSFQILYIVVLKM